MKNSTANFRINAVEGTIEMTNKANKAIQNIGSEEYLEFVQLRKDFPDFRVVVKSIKKKTGKKSYKGLSIEEMKRFVATKGKAEAELFDKVITLAKTKNGSYALIKKWFLKNYKDEYNNELDALKAELEELENDMSFEEEELEEVA